MGVLWQEMNWKDQHWQCQSPDLSQNSLLTARLHSAVDWNIDPDKCRKPWRDRQCSLSPQTRKTDAVLGEGVRRGAPAGRPHPPPLHACTIAGAQ